MTHNVHSEAPEPAAAQVAVEPDTWQRLHPLTPIIDGGLVLVIVIGIVIANMRDAFINRFVGSTWSNEYTPEGEWGEPSWFESNIILVVALSVLGLIIIVLGFAWLSWFFHSYQINGSAVEMRKGILFRKHRRAPLDRIQSVNLQRPLIARLFGLTKIQVQTGGSDGEVALAFLSHGVAKDVRQQILRTAAAVSAGKPAPGTEAAKEASGSALAEELDRRAQEFVDDDIDYDDENAVSLVQVPAGRLVGSIVLSHEAMFLYLAVILLPFLAASLSWYVLTALIPIVIAFAGILISRFNKGFNFSISQSGNGIRTGSGLTSTSTDTIPRHRIHAIDISQPLWWRPFGWWRIRLTTAGSTAANTGNSNQGVLENVVLPVGKRDDVLAVAGLIAPHLSEPGEQHWVLDALDGPGTGFTKAGPRSAFLLLFGRRRAGISIAHGDTLNATVRIRRGAFTRHLVMLPIARAQSIMLHRPMVHAWLGLATIVLHTVMGPVSAQMRGLARSDAQQWWNYLANTAVRVQRGDEAPRRAPRHAAVEEPEQ